MRPHLACGTYDIQPDSYHLLFLHQLQEAPASSPADKLALMGFGDNAHAVRFIQQGLPAHVEQELIDAAIASGIKTVLVADRRR